MANTETQAAGAAVAEAAEGLGDDVLHDAEVDVAYQRCRPRRCHAMLDHDAVFEDRDLGVAGALVRRFGADPANASAPLVATLVDVSGIIIYFTVAKLFLSGILI